MRSRRRRFQRKRRKARKQNLSPWVVFYDLCLKLTKLEPLPAFHDVLFPVHSASPIGKYLATNEWEDGPTIPLSKILDAEKYVVQSPVQSFRDRYK